MFDKIGNVRVLVVVVDASRKLHFPLVTITVLHHVSVSALLDWLPFSYVTVPFVLELLASLRFMPLLISQMNYDRFSL